MNKMRYFFLFGMILFLAGCANYKLHYNPPEETKLRAIPNDAQKLSRLFLIGDAGAINSKSKKTFAMLERMLENEPASSKIIFLGDNIYPSGMPTRDSVRRVEAEGILDFQVNATKGFEGDVIFLPGNHDWAKSGKDGLKNVKRQGAYIKEEYSSNVKMIPEKGCPGPEVITIGDEYAIVIIDSQWWLQDWDIVNRINEKCDALTRQDFIVQFKDAIKDHTDKQLIIAMHHPLYTNGSHGGYYSAKEHFFPLGSISHGLKNIPLPILGSIYPFLRGTFGNVQDIPHHKYKDMKDAILAAVAEIQDVVFASGHEHGLQFQQHLGQHFIVSGSGAKENPVANTKDLVFGHGHTGYFTLDCYDKGMMHVQAWEPADDLGEPKMVFEYFIQHPKETTEPIFSEYDKALLEKDSTVAIISVDYSKGGLYRALFGEHYRELYDLPIQAKILNLEEEKGGLEILKKGGGMQTTSLRLEASDEQQYVIRGLKKDASGLVPGVFQGTFALELLQDQLTASHPYAAFVVPKMADAVEVYHTNPEVVYLPEQEALGQYNKEFADRLYLFEERPDDDGRSISGFGGSKKIVSTFDATDDILGKHDHFVDVPFTVRTRLFDMFLGDWDRHDDQWRWATFEEGNKTIYRPIPRDRDQVFSDYNGFISRLAYSYLSTFRKFGPFKNDISRINWFNYNARYFDRFFLNESTLEMWQTQAKKLEAALTDEVITDAINGWPASVRKEYGADVLDKLKERKTHILRWAEEYYRFLAQEVDVYGTEDDDLFEIKRQEDGSTNVQIFEWRDGKKRNKQYERTFFPAETKAIHIYGLDDDDRFEFQGDEANGIEIRIVGGDGHDIYEDKSKVARKKLHIYDEHKVDNKRNDFGPGIKYTEIIENGIEYNRKGFRYNFGLPQFLLGANPDEGLILGGGFQWLKHGFQKRDFASRHTITGSYSFGTGGLRFSYMGEFGQVIGDMDVVLNSLYEGPSYVQNFFGLGNETPRLMDDLDFYRVIHTRYGAYPSLRKRFERKRGAFSLTPFYEYVSLERTAERFIENAPVDPEAFSGKEYYGGSAKLHYQMKDHVSLTRRGMDFKAEIGVRQELNGDSKAQTFIKSSLSFYYPLNRFGKPVIASRIGFVTNGGDFDFYNGATLGGRTNFRGLANQRLIGKNAFYQNIDIRYRLFSYRSYLLPGAIGLTLSFDHGRVWTENDISEVWHYSYGGGIWLSPFNELIVSANYNISDLNQRFTLQMGFFF